jgi:hypothetical protein
MGVHDEGPTLEGMTDGDPFGFATKSDLVSLVDRTRLSFDQLSRDLQGVLKDVADRIVGEAASVANNHAGLLSEARAAINSHADAIDEVRAAAVDLQRRSVVLEAQVLVLDQRLRRLEAQRGP